GARQAGPAVFFLRLPFFELAHPRVPALGGAGLVLEPAHRLERGRAAAGAGDPRLAGAGQRRQRSHRGRGHGARLEQAAAAQRAAQAGFRLLVRIFAHVRSLSRFRYSVPPAASLRAAARLNPPRVPSRTSEAPPHHSMLPPAFIARLPPSTGSVAPVVMAASDEARNSTAPTTSSGLARRPIGMPRRNVASSVSCSNFGSARRPRRPGVRTWHGATASTRTPRRAHSSARSLVIWTTPALATS